MAHIPNPLPNDAEDVAWSLSTAETLWKRGEHADALVWLRRGAEAASDAQDDDRALALARTAAELKDWLEARAKYAQTDVIEADASGGIDVVVSASFPPAEELEELEEIEPDASIPPAPLEPEQTVPIHGATSPGTAPLPQFSLDDHVPIAPSIHEQVTREAPMVETLLSTSSITRVAPPAPETMPQYRQGQGIPAPPSSKEFPASERALPPIKPPSGKMPAVVLPPLKTLPRPPVAAGPQTGQSAPSPRIPLPFPPPQTSRDLALAEPVGEDTLNTLESTKPASVRVPPPGEVDLSKHAVFSGLPEQARATFANAASVVKLPRGEELPAAALTLVLEGQVTVSAAVVDATALVLGPGRLIRSHGTIESHLAIRLIAGSENATVVCWSDEVVDQALVHSPAADHELRRHGNRIQAICGATIGPLGERLDANLLESVTERLEAVPYGAGALVVESGAHPGIVLVGAGEVVADNGAIFTSGDFVFPELVLGGGKATCNVRAAEGGAVVLAGDRSVVQELLATSPTLIEILAGM